MVRKIILNPFVKFKILESGIPKMFFKQIFCFSKRCYSLNSHINTPETFYDIAIVGGGLVGNAMACSLGKIKLRRLF